MAAKRKSKLALKRKQKKAPVGKPKKPTGAAQPSRGRTRTRDSQTKVSPKKRPIVKPARKPTRKPAPKPAPPRKPIPRRPAKPAPKKAPKLPPLSKHPEAARSRRRRGLARERARLEELKREERNRKRREQRKRKKAPIDEQDLARGWLEMIHARMSEVFGSTLEIVVPGGGAARPEDRDRQSPFGSGNSPWMICGRFDPTEIIGYQQLALALALVQDDVFIEAAVHPQRLSQLRFMFDDPSGKRVAEGDDVLSHIGGWTFILGDALRDLIGVDPDSPGEDSFAVRYANTTVRVIYIFFSREIVAYRTAPGFLPTTQEVKLR